MTCADVFSSLLQKAERDRRIHGFKVSKNAPTVSHLFFADDSLLFFRSNRQELSEIQNIIHQYEVASGQRINLEKTELTASRNVQHVIEDLCARVGVQRVKQHQKYLGLPTIIGRSKKQVFSILVDKVQKKCKGWKDHALSKAGKEVMLKVVIQAIPAYTMNCFLLPNNILHAIEQMMARFYWGSKDGNQKIHWMAWLKMTKRKEDGGLGFRELRCFNLAMLARQWWYLLHNQDTIIFKILKAKYFPRQDLNEANLGYRPSYMWRSLLNAREIINEGSAWRIGNGESVRAKSERWIGVPFPKRISGHSENVSGDFRVAELINHELGEWNKMLVQQFFPDDADRIIAIPISSRMPCDRRVWGYTKDGRFTVKSAYRLAVSMESDEREGGIGTSVPSNQWRQIWNLKILPKMTHFLWQACNESLPTMVNLVRRGVQIDPTCRLCGEEDETQTHLFLRCRTTTHIWRASALRLKGIANLGSFKNFLWCSLMRYPKEFVELLAVIAWNIWIARNKKCMENKEWSSEEVLSKIQRVWEEVSSISTNQHSKASRPRNANPKLWDPPRMGWLKLDIDVAVLSPLKIGMGFVLRRDDGEMILAAKKGLVASGGSTLLEGLAVKYALDMVKERGYDRIVVANDNKGMIQTIRGEVIASEFDQMVVDDIKELTTAFHHISFTHILREFNNAAHFMARGKDGVYCNSVPEHIKHSV